MTKPELIIKINERIKKADDYKIESILSGDMEKALFSEGVISSLNWVLKILQEE